MRTSSRASATAFERELIERGMAGADTALAAQEAFGLQVEHARYLTAHDLAAMIAMQYEHAGLAPLWPLLETALLEPDGEAWLDAPPEPLLHYVDGEARIALFEPRAWKQRYAADATVRHDPAMPRTLERLHKHFQARQRQIAAVLGAHGVAVTFVHVPTPHRACAGAIAACDRRASRDLDQTAIPIGRAFPSSAPAAAAAGLTPALLHHRDDPARHARAGIAGGLALVVVGLAHARPPRGRRCRWLRRRPGDARACTSTWATPLALATMLSMSPPWCAPLSALAVRLLAGIEMPAGAGGVGRAAIALLVDVDGVHAAGRQAADLAGDAHAVRPSAWR